MFFHLLLRVEKKLRCDFCGNEREELFDVHQRLSPCRVCLPYQTNPIRERISPIKVHQLVLHYTLTEDQQRLSQRLSKAIEMGQDVMVDAVTGSGKTEIVFASILECLNRGGNVAFVIPRRDVVRELYPRLKQAFPCTRCVEVFGGHTDDVIGDITVLTTHQLYRYEAYFDLIIFDEVDAFPYTGNRLLKHMVKRAKKGSIVYLSATFTPYVLDSFKKQGGRVEHLFTRHHGMAMPNFRFIRLWEWLSYGWILDQLTRWIHQKKPVLIFVPTLMHGQRLFRWLAMWRKQGKWVHAQTRTRDEDIDAFKQGKLHYLVCTSILERGITLLHLQVIIAFADHPLMEEKTLIQMAGRVGRKKEDPYGEVVVFSQVITQAMETSQKRIHFANQHVSTMLS